MLAAMTSQDLNEWAAFYRVDPWGDQRADLRSAIVASQISGVMGKGSPPKTFMPFREIVERDPEEIAHRLQRMLRGAIKGQR